MSARRHYEAISQYSAALSLNPVVPLLDVFTKRCEAYMEKGLWGNAVDDANQVLASALYRSGLMTTSSPGNHAQSTFSLGIREEACSFA